jgi:anti-sigma B factor antagonist
MDGELVVEKSEQAWVLILRGEHDLTTAPTLDAELSAVFAYGTTVVVDLTEASFVDSSIAGALVRAWETAEGKEGSAVAICAPTGSVARRLLDLIGATRVIPTYETRADALARLDGV